MAIGEVAGAMSFEQINDWMLFVCGALFLLIGFSILAFDRKVELGFFVPGAFCVLISLKSGEQEVGYAIRAFTFVSNLFGMGAAQLVIALTIIGIGIFAHWLRQRNLPLYAVVEVLFGSLTALNVAAGIAPGAGELFSRFATLGGCAYVVARGLNNYSDLRSDHPRQ